MQLVQSKAIQYGQNKEEVEHSIVKSLASTMMEVIDLDKPYTIVLSRKERLDSTVHYTLAINEEPVPRPAAAPSLWQRIFGRGKG
jgi:hypothetical protein